MNKNLGFGFSLFTAVEDIDFKTIRAHIPPGIGCTLDDRCNLSRGYS